MSNVFHCFGPVIHLSWQRTRQDQTTPCTSQGTKEEETGVLPLNDLSISKRFHNLLIAPPWDPTLHCLQPTGIQGPRYNLQCVYLYIYFLFIGGGTHMVWHVCGIQRTNQENQFSLYATWALGIELVSSSLAVSTIIH